MMVLDDRRVDVWLLSRTDVDEHALMDCCESVASEAQLRRGARLAFPADRRMFFLSQGFLRAVLSNYAAMRPQEWEFAASPHGKPHIANAGACEWPSFNLSHTRAAVAVAVARAPFVGVDIEQARDGVDTVGLAQRFFSPREAADVRRSPDGERPRTFFRYWTLKEAYIKARGEGLAIPLERFSFGMHAPGRIAFAADSSLDASPTDWKFCQTQLADDHFLGLCVGRRATQTHARLLRCGAAAAAADGLLEAFAWPQSGEMLELPEPAAYGDAPA